MLGISTNRKNGVKREELWIQHLPHVSPLHKMPVHVTEKKIEMAEKSYFSVEAVRTKETIILPSPIVMQHCNTIDHGANPTPWPRTQTNKQSLLGPKHFLSTRASLCLYLLINIDFWHTFLKSRGRYDFEDTSLCLSSPPPPPTKMRHAHDCRVHKFPSSSFVTGALFPAVLGTSGTRSRRQSVQLVASHSLQWILFFQCSCDISLVWRCCNKGSAI